MYWIIGANKNIEDIDWSRRNKHWNLQYSASCWLVVVSVVYGMMQFSLCYICVCQLLLGWGRDRVSLAISCQVYPTYLPSLFCDKHSLLSCMSATIWESGKTSACLDVWKRLFSAITYYYCYSIYGAILTTRIYGSSNAKEKGKSPSCNHVYSN